MNLLKPCPFCGETEHLHIYHFHKGNGLWGSYVVCEECAGSGPLYMLKNDAIDAWNRRADYERI